MWATRRNRMLPTCRGGALLLSLTPAIPSIILKSIGSRYAVYSWVYCLTVRTTAVLHGRETQKWKLLYMYPNSFPNGMKPAGHRRLGKRFR